MASSGMTTQQTPRPGTSELQTQNCRLLALPAELRNGIWNFVFEQEDEIDLLTSTGPYAALPQTCHQIREETRGMYWEALDLYFSTGNFVVDVKHDEQCCKGTDLGRPHLASNLRDSISALQEDRVERVARLTIRGPLEYKMYEDGMWHREFQRSSRFWPCSPQEEVLYWTFDASGVPRFARSGDPSTMERAKMEAFWPALTKRRLTQAARANLMVAPKGRKPTLIDGRIVWVLNESGGGK